MSFGGPSSPKESQRIENDNREKSKPDDAFKTPPAVLKAEVRPDGDFAINFPNAILYGL
jgi:hypothetical protein